jgi:hypothetical protein
VYTQVGQNTISLSIEESKVGQLILQAKELSIATYSTNGTTCAYGVQFNPANSTYSLFEYNSAVKPPLGGGRAVCPSLASTTAVTAADIQEYTGGSWQVHTATGVVLKAGGAASSTIVDVMFYPPDPFTLVSLDGKKFLYPAPASHVYLSTANGSDARTITVNAEGQVSL